VLVRKCALASECVPPLPCNNEQRETVTVLIDTIAAVHRELGIVFEFINIGGGLGIPYRPEQQAVDVSDVAATIKSVLDTRIATHALPFIPRLYMENGRYMTGPFGWLVARCEVVKSTYARFAITCPLCFVLPS
jgi:diaminopimelate decarboxylase